VDNTDSEVRHTDVPTAWGTSGGANGQSTIAVALPWTRAVTCTSRTTENNRIRKFDNDGTFPDSMDRRHHRAAAHAYMSLQVWVFDGSGENVFVATMATTI